jgi:hypothetical protein
MAGSFFGARPAAEISDSTRTTRTPSAATQRSTAAAFSSSPLRSVA